MAKDTEAPLALVIAAGKPKKGAPEDDSAGGSTGEDAAAEDAVAASQVGDAEAFGKAMKAFVRICMRKYGGPPSYEE